METSKVDDLSRITIIYEVITVIFLIAAVGVISATLLIVNDPSVPFNPLPLVAIPTRYIIPSSTVTPTPTHTPSPSATSLPTYTPTATITVTASATPTITATSVIAGAPPPATISVPEVTANPDLPITGSGNNAQPGVILATSTPSATLSPFPFVAQIRYMQNANEQGCQWSSIAGTVTGLANEPLTDLAIEINGNDVEAVVFTGSNPLFGFSGFEFPLGSSPSIGQYQVRLVSATGVPISDFVFVTTGDTCDRNVTVVDFQQTRSY